MDASEGSSIVDVKFYWAGGGGLAITFIFHLLPVYFALLDEQAVNTSVDHLSAHGKKLDGRTFVFLSCRFLFASGLIQFVCLFSKAVFASKET